MAIKQKVILIGLNEINFEFVEKYILKGKLPMFKKIFEQNGFIQTSSEYEYKHLEPWIQWVTLHTGKTFAEHQIFRLGDIVEHPEMVQLWNVAESKGLSVAAISPFNAVNNLKAPLFFVPDPWTKTKATGSELLIKLSNAVSQIVNDNAQEKVEKKSLIALLKGFIKYVPASSYSFFMKQILRIKKSHSAKAIFLDQFLAEIFLKEWNNQQPDFSSLFLNSGAHIQHHYMYNSAVNNGQVSNPDWYISPSEDPLIDVLECYDAILEKIWNTGCRIFIATGLHQQPHKHLTYYWRLKDHATFLNLIGIHKYTEVLPRMSRDFLIKCDNEQDALEAEKILNQYQASSDKEKIFEIDNRGKSLFIELIYSNDISDGFTIETKSNNTNPIDFKPYVAFVAIKNGEHNGIGYFVDSNTHTNKTDIIPLTETFNIISASFN